MNGGSSRGTVWVLLGLVACGATSSEDRHTDLPAGSWADGQAPTAPAPPEVDPGAARSCRRLGRSLSRVREHFEAGAGRPRIVALLDHRLHGVEAVRRLVSRPDAGDVRVTLIWDAEPRDDGWAAGLPDDDRVAAFVDRRQVAGRVFARGLLPTARAREVYLVYGPEARWAEDPHGAGAGAGDETPPPPHLWWHRMGRLAPAHHVADLDELAARLAASVVSPPVGR